MVERKDGVPHPFEYKALNGFDAICEIRIYQWSGKTIVVATDLDVGPSVTNNVEVIATLLRQQGVEWDVFCEHYLDLSTDHFREPETFDWVEFRWEEGIAQDPEWKPASRSELQALIGNKFM